MFTVKTYVSERKPSVQSGLWLKPVEGGVEGYVISGNCLLPLKLIGGQAESKDYVGSVKDDKSANTINGAKTYAKEMVSSVIGTSGDTENDLTLHGIKAYVDLKTKKYGSKKQEY